jgi:hypothetical protein
MCALQELPVTVDEKRQAMEAVLASQALSRSERLKKLLRFICEAEIEGRGEALNEYAIGVEALGRPEGYSTLEDSSVRSRTYELRQRLEKYYSSEAPHAPIRIELIKGSHTPRFVRTRMAASTEVPDAPQAERCSANRRLLATLFCGFFAGVLLTWLIANAWPGQSNTFRPSLSPSETALTAIWQPMLDSGAPVVISFEPRLFVRFGPLAIRDYRVNDMAQVESSDSLMKIKGLFRVQQLHESPNYADLGFVHAGFLLGRQLGTRRVDIYLKRSTDLTWNEIRSSNLIFLGKPHSDPQIRHFLSQTEFVYRHNGVMVLHPKAGEPQEYVEKVDLSPAGWSEKYCIITMMPGVTPGRHILSLAASGTEHSWAVASYVTDPVKAKELVKHLRLPSGKLPEYYQVVVRARFKGLEPTDIDYMTHRVLTFAKKR